ncbi:hypothetical protein ACWEJQ_08070 [Streptomyces albidoflavus]
MAMTLRLPDDLDAEARAELNVHDILAELTETDSEILDHLK